jgi:uncharacterized BrkB/YihY/UPF0761 family membrane protein
MISECVPKRLSTDFSIILTVTTLLLVSAIPNTAPAKVRFLLVGRIVSGLPLILLPSAFGVILGRISSTRFERKKRKRAGE